MNEDDYKNDLTQMLLKYYHFSVPGIVWGQLKNYHNNLKMTYEGMCNTFLYVLEVKGLAFDAKYGIGYVKVFYRDGHSYTKNPVNNKPQIKISRRQITIKKQSHRPILKKLDLSEIDLKEENIEHD